MQKFVRLGYPVLIGIACYVALCYLIWNVSWHVFGESAEVLPDHWYFVISPWADILQSLLPGFLVGYFAKDRPLLSGAAAMFLGSALCSTLSGAWWLPPYALQVIWWGIQYAVLASLYGVAGAAVGFLAVGMNTYYASKPTL